MAGKKILADSMPAQDPKFFVSIANNSMLREDPRGKKVFEIDEENCDAIEILTEYFTFNAKFEIRKSINLLDKEHNFDLMKGILLMGNVGSGKSLIMRIFWESQLRRFGLKTCRQISKEYANGGYKAVEKYGDKAVHLKTNQDIVKAHLCLDDLGSEKNEKFYGNESNVLAELIQDRYDHFVKHKLITHFTTNLTPEELSIAYGDRVISRLNQMCNVIVLGTGPNSKDRR